MRSTPKYAKLSRQSSSESSPPWSDLTPLALELTRDLLDSNLYDLRLRSVCSNWRKSLPHPRRTRSPNFPINLPPIPETKFPDHPRNPQIPTCSRIYRISPADDPSHGWLFRSLDTKPNTFTLLDLLGPVRVGFLDVTIRNSLDLLQFRVSEICECYRIDGVEWLDVDKVLVLHDFVEGVDFTVLVVLISGNMYYCNDGDSAWTAIEIGKYRFQDVVFFNGVCYAVCEDGSLVSLNSDFHLTEVIPPNDLRPIYKRDVLKHNSLVAFESDLFLVSASFPLNEPVKVQVFKWVLATGWNQMSDLGDTILLSRSDVSVGLSAKDFKGCKGNFVYLADAFSNQFYEDWAITLAIRATENQIHDLDESRPLNSKKRRRRIKMCWPPPDWMRPTS